MDERARGGHGATEAGFTLLEAMISLAVMTVVLIGLLTLLQVNSRVAKAQVNVAEMQQSLRVVQSDMVRMTRMAGRGGLPSSRLGMPLPEGPSIEVANRVPAGTRVAEHDRAAVVAGTDILTVRGVISTPLYQVNPAGDGNVRNAKAAGDGSITVRRISPSGVPQDLDWLTRYAEDLLPEALLLVSAGSDAIQAVVELKGVVDNGDSVTVDFWVASGQHSTEYDGLSPGGQFPDTLRTVAMVGILEEYKYYVRDEPPAPRLSRARLYPGTDAAYANEPNNLHADIADNILDLQVALGIDKNGDGLLPDDGSEEDDWLFNFKDDKKDNPDWNPDKTLHYVRISTLARTDRLDPEYMSPPIVAIEDRDYGPIDGADGDPMDRKYRRRLLQTVVDLRNLG